MCVAFVGVLQQGVIYASEANTYLSFRLSALSFRVSGRQLWQGHTGVDPQTVSEIRKHATYWSADYHSRSLSLSKPTGSQERTPVGRKAQPCAGIELSPLCTGPTPLLTTDGFTDHHRRSAASAAHRRLR